MVPGVDSVLIAQEVAEEGVELFRAAEAVRAGREGCQCGLAIGLPDGSHEPGEFGLVWACEGADILEDVPAVQQPGGVGEVFFAEAFESFIAVAEQDVVFGLEVLVGLELEFATEQGHGFGCDEGVFIFELDASRARGLVAALAAGVMEAQVNGEVLDWTVAAAFLGFEPGGVHFADEGRNLEGLDCWWGLFIQLIKPACAVELDAGPDQPVADLALDPAGDAVGCRSVVLLGGCGTGFLFESRAEQAGGLGTPKDFREAQIPPGSLLPNHPDGQTDGTKGSQPVNGSPALSGEPIVPLLQPR